MKEKTKFLKTTKNINNNNVLTWLGLVWLRNCKNQILISADNKNRKGEKIEVFMTCYAGFPENPIEAFYRLIPNADNNFKNGYIINGYCTPEDGDVIEVSRIRIDSEFDVYDKKEEKWKNPFFLFSPVLRFTNFCNSYKIESLEKSVCKEWRVPLKDDNYQWEDASSSIINSGRICDCSIDYHGNFTTATYDAINIFDIPKIRQRCSQ